MAAQPRVQRPHAGVAQGSRTPILLGRASLDSRRPPVAGSAAASASLMSLSNANNIGTGLGQPSLEIRRGNSFDSRARPGSNPSSNSGSGGEMISSSTGRGLSSASGSRAGSSGLQMDVDSLPSLEIPFHNPHVKPEPDQAFVRPSFDALGV